MWLVEQNEVPKDESELYEFALYTVVLSAVPILVFLVYGSFVGDVLQNIVFLIIFMIIRKYVGGYHAKTIRRCMFLSFLILLGSIYLLKRLHVNWMLEKMLVVSILSIMIWSPIEHPNRILNPIEQKRIKKIIYILMGISYLLYQNSKGCSQRVAAGIALGIILTAILQVPSIIGKIISKTTKKA